MNPTLAILSVILSNNVVKHENREITNFAPFLFISTFMHTRTNSISARKQINTKLRRGFSTKIFQKRSSRTPIYFVPVALELGNYFLQI